VLGGGGYRLGEGWGRGDELVVEPLWLHDNFSEFFKGVFHGLFV
jgi:hypothetical protein